MRTLRVAFALFSLAVASLAPVQAASAAPTAAWQVSLIPLPTNFKPGTSGIGSVAPLYRLVVTNVGAAPATGTVTLRASMPPGLTPLGAVGNDGGPSTPDPTCSVVGQEVTCITSGPVPPGRWLGAIIPLEVTAAAGETLTSLASVEGGGTAATASYEATVDSEPPSFGFLDGPVGFSTLATNSDGSATTQAGGHPDQMTFNLAFPTEQAEDAATTSSGHLRTLITDLPRGLYANPSVTAARCTEVELTGVKNGESGCPAASQVGVVTIMSEIAGPLVIASPIYNMLPPPGAPAELGFEALNVGIFVHIGGRVRSESDYGVSAVTDDVLARANNPLLSAQVQLWGDPSAVSHNEIRGECRSFGGSCPIPESERTGKPLLTMPSHCSSTPLLTEATAKSWEEPNVPHSRKAPSIDTQGNPVGVGGCSTLEFEPTLTLQPETSVAESPTGLEVELRVPQKELLTERATSTLRDVTVNLPQGLAVNPAAAEGRKACTAIQVDLAHGARRPHCPNSSKIGDVQVETPLLDHPLGGAVYIAQPYENPFGALLATYVVVDAPMDGIVVKLAGRTVADPDTGQLTVTFAENPELPVSSFRVELFGGPRAALRTPSACGTFTTSSEMVPWSGGQAVGDADSFDITQGANGGPCVSSEGEMPLQSSFEAGTQVPLAASYSAFDGSLSRDDGTQQLKGLDINLPAGLTGKLAGVETCSDAAIAAAASKSGQQELASPSCPANSQIGEVKVGAGAGPTPYYTGGKIYLAGPEAGAPFSGVVITPAVAGPFDLGTVVVRAPAQIDPATAQVSLHSSDFPHILQGIPLELRDARLSLDRNEFTLNPSNCNEKQITGQVTALLGATTPISQRFQVGGCKGLDYAPTLFIRLKGGTRRGAHPRLRAVLEAKPGEEANTARASVALPRSEFLENAHIQTVCTRVQFAAKQCPKGSIYGHAKALTPLLDEPLEGPVYLRSSSHELPDMVAALHGPASRPIEIELDGRIDSVRGGIRSTFDLVPDQPVSKFILNMKGGNKGLIVNSRNICARTYRAVAKFNGQNGKTHDFKPKLTASCAKKRQNRRHRRR